MRPSIGKALVAGSTAIGRAWEATVMERVGRRTQGCYRASIAKIRALADAGLRHVVLSNLGPPATGPSPRGLLQLAVLIRRLRKIVLRER